MLFKYLSLLAALLFLTSPHLALAENEEEHATDIAAMLDLARKSNMSEQMEWRKILLYHQQFRDWISRVDDPSYFLAVNGKRNPQAELEATIRKAFDASIAANSPQPNYCRYVARYQFLSRQMKVLGFDFPAPQCDGFDRWRADIATHRVSLVFGAIYLNSPASMYGHTFLRFDSEKPDSFSRLNDTTIGYSVGGESKGDPLFLLKSLVGGYPGEFIYAPFFKKIREYSDLESRDMWEYETNLSSAEIEKMLAFIWEQSFTYTDYYFFDDNCAMMLLAAFEAGRPNLELLAEAKPWLIPLDAVKIVHSEPDLITKIHYRPSQFNNAQYNFYAADDAMRRHAVTLLENHRLEEVMVVYDSDKQRADLLDISLAILETQRNQKHSLAEAESISNYQLELSKLRSNIAAESSYQNTPQPPASPDQGHGSFRAGIASGGVNGLRYTQINLRSSNHDELDPESGYAPGARSNMGDLYLRLSNGKVDLQRLGIFEIFAPSVRSDWYSQPTIRFSAAFQREELSNGLAPNAFALDAGGGFGFRVSKQARTFILAESEIKSGKQGSVSIGPTSKSIWSLTDSMRMEFNASARWYASGENRQSLLYRGSAGISYDFGGNQNSLRLTIVRQQQVNTNDKSREFTDVQLGYFHYF